MRTRPTLTASLAAAASSLVSCLPLAAQETPAALPAPKGAGTVPAVLFDTLDWRLVGPFRGGRVAAVTGVISSRDTYYFGGTGGGVWKTTDGGKNWNNVSDGTFGGSIGAVAVAPSNADIVYVGGGESTWRGNVSSGDGVWKSLDAGKTWEFAGLPDSRHISRIRIHPKDPDVVYAAVMGHVSGPSEERGVYRSKDGGKSWQRVLFANAQAGAADLCFSPDDPNVLYATTWRAIRTPWSLESGGDGSGLYKSTDGGDTWQPLHGNKGLPEGTLGISGICVSPADPKRVYAQIEAEAGGLFRSEDAGATWTKVNEDRDLRQRAWYYTRVYADPKDVDTVYVVNVQFHKSTDGGKTFTTIRTPHGDNHDLWIDPKDPARMIEGNDGGACVTTDGGKTWSSIDNQPTAQFYRVAVDDAAPYRIYAAQQDNSTVRIAHRSRGAGIGADDWESTAGGESGWIAPKPGDPEVVYGGSYDGYLVRLDHRTRMSRRVDVWPDNPMGAGAADLKYRFQWNFPILFSKHDPKVLYTAAQVLFASSDEGATWTALSGDLTRNDKSKMGSSGGPITQDNTSVEYYGTIFTVCEGRVPGTIWTGSDDGLVHVTRDGGKTWKDVTPPDAPEWMQWNDIVAGPHGDGSCYVAGTRYKLDDFHPYLYVTHDYGATWRSIVGGLDPNWFTRCVQPDPVRPGLLFCGTERTVWMSFDDGRRWQRFANSLPLVPITDLVIESHSLIAATQGRALWSFDGLEHVRQLDAEQAQEPLHLYAPVTAVQFPGRDGEAAGQGQNPDRDYRVRFYVGGKTDEPVTERAVLEVRDFDGEVVFRRTTDAEKDDEKFEVKRGMNEVVVTWKSEPPKILDKMILWNGRGGAPRAAPGDYPVTLTLGEHEVKATGRIGKDPRTTATVAELQDRYRLSRRCRDAVTKAHEAIETMRRLREQMQTVTDRAEGDAKDKLDKQRADTAAALTAIEEQLYQTKSQSGQDPLNFPIKLTDKLLGVLSATDHAEFGPTAGQKAVADELIAAIDAELVRFEAVQKEQVAAFNKLALELAIPHVK
ncbi:MAG: glycosyl hydrolase [Planctomycetes bacterium]|nr:glycosyl hydrolase [Planctomycetota bacterium]